MAYYTSALSSLLVIVLFSLVKIEARESKFFAKAIVIHDNTTTKNATHHVEPPSPSPAPLKAENSGYGLYGRGNDEIPTTSSITSDSLFESKNIPNEGFTEKFDKEKFNNNDLPSNYNQHSYVTVPQFQDFNNNGLPSNYNEHSYVTGPQGDNKAEFSNNNLPSNYNQQSYVTVPQEENFYDTKFTPTSTNYENEIANNEERFTPEEEKLFNNNGNFNNEHNENAEPQKLSTESTPRFMEKDNYFNNNHNAYNSDNYNVKEPQGLSDTRTLENGKYHYALDGEGRQTGTVKPGPGSTTPSKYNNKGYYGNGENKSKYEFDTMEEFERQEGYSQIP